MQPIVDRMATRVRLAAFLLITGLAVGPLSTHVYWMLGGTWGLHRAVGGDRVVEEGATSTGIRIVAAVVVLLLVVAVLVVLARIGLWQQALVPARVIRFFAYALAAVFLLETLAAFWSREHEWWMYGPVSFVIGVLALEVAASDRAWPRSHRSLPLRKTKEEASRMSMRFTGKYVSLTTFRRDGTPVSTPVWFVSENGRLLVETDGDPYKVKRLRRNDNVTVTSCNAMGHVSGEVVSARATILPPEELPRVERLLHRKYRLDYIFVLPIYLLVQRLRGRPLRYERPVIVSITPT